MTIPGNFMTSGMGVLLHTDLEKGLALAMSVDIPFWPQLPKMRYEEDMHAQVAHRFPGSIISPQPFCQLPSDPCELSFIET